MLLPRHYNLLAKSILLLGLTGLVGLVGCTQQQPVATAPKAYSFWPAPPDQPHVQFLTSYNGSSDVSTSRSQFDEMLYGKATEQGIIKPYGIAMWNGRIYVTDLRTVGVTVLDLRQHQTRIHGRRGSGRRKKSDRRRDWPGWQQIRHRLEPQHDRRFQP